jgi:uncharacterized protein
MLIILSPSKDMKPQPIKAKTTTPQFLFKSEEIYPLLSKLSTSEIEKLMKVSEKIALLNYERFQNLNSKKLILENNAAISLYSGDVFLGVNAQTIDPKKIEKYNEKLFILSALYGALRPLDVIQPYRLEMQTSPFSIGKDKNLYQFWEESIKNKITEKLQGGKLINLASDEYSKLVLANLQKEQVINIVFKEYKNGKLMFISTFAKKARGLMARYAIEHHVTKPEKLKAFDYEKYQFDESLSDSFNWTFTR